MRTRAREAVFPARAGTNRWRAEADGSAHGAKRGYLNLEPDAPTTLRCSTPWRRRRCRLSFRAYSEFERSDRAASSKYSPSLLRGIANCGRIALTDGFIEKARDAINGGDPIRQVAAPGEPLNLTPRA